MHFPKTVRYSIGNKIDNLFSDCLEFSILASYSSHTEKINNIRKLSVKLDCLKFFIQILWEMKIIDHKKYIAISSLLSEAGKMVGGWLKFSGK